MAILSKYDFSAESVIKESLFSEMRAAFKLSIKEGVSFDELAKDAAGNGKEASRPHSENRQSPRLPGDPSAKKQDGGMRHS